MSCPQSGPNRKIKPKNPRLNAHEADMKKLVRNTNLKKFREVH